MAYYLYRWSVYGEKLVVTLTLKDTAGSILAVRKTLSTSAGSQGLGIGLSWTGFILMKTRQEKDIKFNPVSLYVPANRCLWLGNIQLESKTHSSTKASMKMQAFPWYSLGNSLLHLFWPYVEHSHRSVYPLPWWLLGRERPIHSPSSRPFHSQPRLFSTFIPRTIQLLLPKYIKAHTFRKASAWKLNLCITNNVVDVLPHSLDSSFLLNWRASWSCSHQDPGSGPSPCH